LTTSRRGCQQNLVNKEAMDDSQFDVLLYVILITLLSLNFL
jgi:hypothetical protein